MQNIIIQKKISEKKYRIEKQMNQYRYHLNKISKNFIKIINSSEPFNEFIYFIDNGNMNGEILDYDLSKEGNVISMIADYLEGKGYLITIEEGKNKEINRYGTFINISIKMPNSVYEFDFC